jgi:hypothetical protein
MGQSATAPWVEPILEYKTSDSVPGECRRPSLPEKSTDHAAHVDSG